MGLGDGGVPAGGAGSEPGDVQDERLAPVHDLMVIAHPDPLHDGAGALVVRLGVGNHLVDGQLGGKPQAGASDLSRPSLIGGATPAAAMLSSGTAMNVST